MRHPILPMPMLMLKRTKSRNIIGPVLQRGARATAMEAYRACLKVGEDRTACKTKLVNIMKDITGDEQRRGQGAVEDRRIRRERVSLHLP